MNIKYSKLNNYEGNHLNCAPWLKHWLPVNFLKQQIFLVSLVFASIILFLFSTFLPRDFDSDDISFDYSVIIDCGSSGSRAHIFRWRKGTSDTRIQHVLDEESRKPLNRHITPGLSAFKDDPDKASDYMEPLIYFIMDSIPQDRHKDTPIYIMATAGLRLLDDKTQKRILSDIDKDLNEKFGFQVHSQVISGSFEGVYSWLSLNMHRNPFNNSLGLESYGMIEMGGASTQVTFEITPALEKSIIEGIKDKEAISAFKSEQVSIDLGPRRSIKLFATTFLGLGVNSAREAAIDLLVRDHLQTTNPSIIPKVDTSGTAKVSLKDPCLTTGSSETVLRSASMVSGVNRPIGLVIKANEKVLNVELEGTGDFLNCMSLLERTLQVAKKEKLNCHNSKPCPMALLGTDFIPYSHYQFMGLSEMFFTTNEMINSAGTFNRSKIMHETQKICNTPYERLIDSFPEGMVSFKDRILYECFKASWLLTILHKSGFKMPSNYDNFNTLEQLNGQLVDWTMGAIFSKIGLNKSSF